MSDPEDFEAWNNFVLNSQPEDYQAADLKHFAALAKNYMNGAESGGINSFLTNNWQLGGQEVLNALNAVGAVAAARQFAEVLNIIDMPILASTQYERWDFLEKYWPENAVETFDLLSDAAEKSLMFALEQHVQKNEEFYRSLK
jgi:hypothetical protein